MYAFSLPSFALSFPVSRSISSRMLATSPCALERAAAGPSGLVTSASRAKWLGDATGRSAGFSRGRGTVRAPSRMPLRESEFLACTQSGCSASLHTQLSSVATSLANSFSSWAVLSGPRDSLNSSR